ncbi:unnamed protein product [Cladocopium goreaui]|uniref:Uncharacterized protein n=1 Tax=Cladocopium goreaui TaxID=2562237 RepID=A0A9P1DQP2_9DINO|nr:unnamed protein product [Cladocopium goreaui]
MASRLRYKRRLETIYKDRDPSKAAAPVCWRYAVPPNWDGKSELPPDRFEEPPVARRGWNGANKKVGFPWFSSFPKTEFAARKCWFTDVYCKPQKSCCLLKFWD